MSSETAPSAPGRRGSSLRLRFAIAFLLGVVLVVGAGGGALYAYGQQYSGRVLPGVSVGETDLSGLTPDAATKALATAYASLGTGQLLLMGPDGEVTVGYAELGRAPDVQAMLGDALAAGRLGEPVADLIGAPQTAIRGVTLGAEVTYDPARLTAAVDAVATAIDRSPVDATLAVKKDGTYSTTPSVEGRVVDRAALATAIETAISPLGAPSEIRLDIPFTTGTPTIETADVEAATAAADRMAADVVLTRGTDTWAIPAARIRKLISFAPTADGSVAPVLDEAGITPLLKPIARMVNQTVKSAGFKLNGDRVVVVGTSREGRMLDSAATKALIVEALSARQAGTQEPVLEPVVATTQPDMTSAEAKAAAPRMRVISTWTTWFPIWSHNAFGANIWVPAGIINGYVVKPGETFDFWKVVGDVNRSKGYGLGGAIINGHTQAQGAIGGGICSCSTTLFNAALRAGFKMGARKNHYYYIDRYPLGLDATVFISAGGAKQTMSWTNDTKYPVLIRGIRTRGNGKGYVTFNLYSVPTGRKVSISSPIVKNVHQAGDSTERSNTLRAGYSQRVEYPADGKDVWRTVTVRQNGKVISKKTYYTHYSTVTGVVIIGTGGPSAPTKLP